MEGCICAEGYVLDNAEETCIPVEACGCSTDDNYYAVSYGEWVYIQEKHASTVDSRYLEIEGTLKNSSRYPYFDISDL